jgi:putative ABC transport system permease protein
LPASSVLKGSSPVVHRWAWIRGFQNLGADVRYALRILRLHPGFTATASLTLALGIGATTAVFTVVDGVLLKPFPVKDQQRLLVVWKSAPDRGMANWPFNYRSYEGMRERLHTVTGLAAHPYADTLTGVLHRDDGSAQSLQRTAVTGEWFNVVGVLPRAGRLLTAADDRVGAAPVVVLSSVLAERLFGNVGNAIGRTLRVDEGACTVVGVTPAGFEYPRGAEAWMPAAPFRPSPYVAWNLMARVAPGFTIEQARAELQSVMASLKTEPGLSGQRISAMPFGDVMVGDVRLALLMLGGAVVLMLIVAGVNVANLLLVRGLARRREFAVRTAIGASRGRLVRQLATEALVLSAGGAVLAAFVAQMALRGLLALAPAELPRISTIAIDGRALTFTSVAAIVAALLFGILPALHTARGEPAEALRATDRSAARGTRQYWLRHGLVIAQVAVATLVLSTAGLLLRSFDRMQRLPLGFAAEGVVLAEVALPSSRYPEPADLQRAMVRLAEYVATLPGISHASAVVSQPFAGTQGVDAIVYAEGQRINESANPFVNYEGTDPYYFATLGLPILRGRGIEARDRARSQPVLVVNESFARLFWPGQDPIGRRIEFAHERSAGKWRTVVGLVADTRYRELTTVRPSIYVPYPQGIPVGVSYLAVRTTSPTSIAGVIRQALMKEEPGAAVTSVTPLPRLLAAPLARPRFQSALITSFGTLGFVLSVIGTYGVLAFFVRQRRREIGIRMALGAAPSNVRRLVLRQGLFIGVVGAGLGVAAAFAAGRLLQPLLFEVTPTDPLALLTTAAALIASTVAATLLPTRMAARTNPLIVLRND